MSAPERDRSRRYLVTVGPYPLPDEPQDAHLALVAWQPRLEMWLHGQAICGRTVPQGEQDDGTTVTCPECLAARARYEEILANDPADLLNAYAAVFKQLPRKTAAELVATLMRDPLVPKKSAISQAAVLASVAYGMGWTTEKTNTEDGGRSGA